MSKDGITLTNIRHPRGKPALGDLNPESLEQVEIDLPERTWVGLTDEEIRSIAKPTDDTEILMTGRMWVFVGDLMEKLKEKNNG